MCLKRSYPAALDVTVGAYEGGRVLPGCTCDKDRRGRLLPNEGNPCEWHFTFESLATSVHSKRIRTLSIDFRYTSFGRYPSLGRKKLLLGGCRFFSMSFPQLTNLEWKSAEMGDTIHLFSNPPFTPTVSSLSFEGSWDGLFTRVKNLTSFTFMNYEDTIHVETFRLFMSNNRSLESLSLHITYFEGNTKGPPVDLLHLKSFTLPFYSEPLSTIIRIPALQRLSSLRISYEGACEDLKLVATGDGITLSVVVLDDIAEVWQSLVGYAQPTIGHVSFCDYPQGCKDCSGNIDGSTIIPLLADAHTLEVGRDYLKFWYRDFLDDLKQLGSQLKTIRFEVWEEVNPYRWGDYRDEMSGHDLLDKIEELVRHRFEIGRPFSAVERMVVCESERSNRQQGYVWRCFYGDRKLGQYVQPI